MLKRIRGCLSTNSRLTFLLATAFVLVMGSMGLYGQETADLFVEVTAETGTAFKHNADQLIDIENAFGTGAAWFDYDRDSDLDLYVTQRTGSNRLFENDGNGAFTNVAAALGVGAAGYDCGGVAVADFNNDGWLDMYVATAAADILYKNIDGTRFVNIYHSAGFDPQWTGRGTSASWGDYDNDGFLDLYVAQHINPRSPHLDNNDRLFRNNGDETFTDVSFLLGESRLSGFGFIAGWSDFDNDGDLDIYLINDCPFNPKPHQLFRNDGGSDPLNWQFTEISAAIGAGMCQHGMGIAIGDYNRDGWQDYFFTNIGRATLCENKRGTFEDMTEQVKVGAAVTAPDNRTAITWGCNFVDYDLDGWLDLYVAAGPLRHTDTANAQPNFLYHNEGQFQPFRDASAASGIDNPLPSRTSVFGDYDGDGDPDLYLVNYGNQAALYRNDNANGNRYLIVDLQGSTSNRDGIGSRLKLTAADGTVQYLETHSGTSLGGGDDLGANFGLGTNTSVAELEIRWPSGIRQVLNDIEADQRLKVIEPAAPDGIPQTPILLQNYPNPFNPSTTIRWGMPEPGKISLAIFNSIGQPIASLAGGEYDAGYHAIQWDGTDDQGNRVTSGVYVVRFSSGNLSQARLITLSR